MLIGYLAALVIVAKYERGFIMKRLTFSVLLILSIFLCSGCFSSLTEKKSSDTVSERRNKPKERKTRSKKKDEKESGKKIDNAEESTEATEGDSASAEIKSDRYGIGDEKTELFAKHSEYNNPFIYLKGYNDWIKHGDDISALDLAPDYKHIGYAIWIDNKGLARDAYMPYGGALSIYSNYIIASNHGVTVRKTMVDGENASSVLESPHLYYSTKIQGAKVSQIRTFDDDTVGLIFFYYEEDYEGEPYRHFGIYYADIK